MRMVFDSVFEIHNSFLVVLQVKVDGGQASANLTDCRIDLHNLLPFLDCFSKVSPFKIFITLLQELRDVWVVVGLGAMWS